MEELEQAWEELSTVQQAETETTGTPVENVAEEVTEGKDVEVTEEAQAPVEEIELPSGWKSEYADLYKSADPALREAISGRIKDLEKGLHEKAQKAKMFEDFSTQNAQVLSQFGHTPQDQLNALVQSAAFAIQNPVAFAQQLLQQRGIDPRTAFQAQQQQQPELDPVSSQLYQNQRALEQQLLQQQRLQQQAYIDQGLNTFDTLAKDVENHPYMAELKQEIGRLIDHKYGTQHIPPAQIPQVIKEAYETAVWSNPETRQKMLDAQYAAKAAKQQEAVQKAKKASVGVKGAPGVTGAAGQNVNMSLEDELSTIWDKMAG